MNIRIEWSYETPKGIHTIFISDEMPIKETMLLAEDLMKTGRTKNLTFIDSYDSTWTLKELKKYTEEVEAEPHSLEVFFDGGFNPESKKAGLGCAVYYEQNERHFRHKRNTWLENIDSNNEAEYASLHLALTVLEEMNVHHMPVVFKGDSRNVIQQMSGEWALLEPTLTIWADRIDKKIAELGIRPQYQLLTRKENEEADRLASQALKEIEIKAVNEVKR